MARNESSSDNIKDEKQEAFHFHLIYALLPPMSPNLYFF